MNFYFMGRKKAEDAKIINRIKEASNAAGASSRLISLWTDVNYTTVSSWNSNTSQPGEVNLNEIGELLEEDNRNLLASQGRHSTGLAKALEQKLRALHKEECLPYEVEQFDKKKGKIVKVNNPELVKRLKKFAEGYKNR